MEKKTNIKTLVIKLDGRENPFISSPDHKGKILDHYQYNNYTKEELNDYCHAIVTAVNNTYGKGIDPEKIGDVLLWAGNVLAMIEPNNLNEAEALNSLKQALNNIKLK